MLAHTLRRSGHVDVSMLAPPLAGFITCCTAVLVSMCSVSLSEEDIMVYLYFVMFLIN
jgi:hypothetical protein